MKLKISVVLLSLLFSCHISRENAEKVNLSLIFLDGLKQPKKLCFDTVNGDGAAVFDHPCSDSLSGQINLPLDITRDSCRFVFTKEKRKDSILVTYTRVIVKDDNGYRMNIKNIRISEFTFQYLNDTSYCKAFGKTYCNNENTFMVIY